MNVGIYGGTFNPLHNGHIALAKAFLNQCGLDEVWFVVSPQNPFKVDKVLLDDKLRLQMVREALKDEPVLKVSDVEFHLPKPSYMYRTLHSLSTKYPDASFTLLIGGDNWKAFGRWKNADEIVKNYRIAVYPRRGENIVENQLPGNVVLLRMPLIDISSTEIRQKIQNHRSITGLVPSAVERFIVENNCYK